MFEVRACLCEKKESACAISYLSNHPIPDAPNHLAVLPVGDQIKVIWKFDSARELLQDVYAETFAAEFGVRLCVTCDTAQEKIKEKCNITKHLQLLFKNKLNILWKGS